MIRQIVCEITSRILDLPHYLIKTGLIIECIFFFSFQIANNITLSFANAHSSMILFAICKKKNMHSIINRSGSNKNVKSKNPGLYFTNDGVLSHNIILVKFFNCNLNSLSWLLSRISSNALQKL